MTPFLALALTSCGGGATSVGVGLQEFAVVQTRRAPTPGEGRSNSRTTATRRMRSSLSEPILGRGTSHRGGRLGRRGGLWVKVLDDVEEILSGEFEELTVDLEAENYVLICNIVEEKGGETEAHYALGMRAGSSIE